MYFGQAYEQATRLGREIKQDIAGQEFQDPNVFTSLSRAQATAENWVVSDEKAVTVTPAVLAKAWNDAVAAGGFGKVKSAEGSDLFKLMQRNLFTATVGTAVRR